MNLSDGGLERGFRLNAQVREMAQHGVESVVTQIVWADLEPKEGSFDWSDSDRLMSAFARRGIRWTPVVLWTPDWARARPQFRTPRSAAVGRFVAAFAERYGSRGTFWRTRAGRRVAKVPVRDIQLWNEPYLKSVWDEPGHVKPYVAMLRSTHYRLRKADPHARLVLAGLSDDSWNKLGDYYAAGARGHFDAVSMHPFSARPRGVLQILRLVRRALDRRGDRRVPILATELSAPASQPYLRFKSNRLQKTRASQARFVRELYPLLARERRRLKLEQAAWYAWVTADERSNWIFDYAGLRYFRDGAIRDKPALAAYRRTVLRLQGCRVKSSRADRCSRRR